MLLSILDALFRCFYCALLWVHRRAGQIVPLTQHGPSWQQVLNATQFGPACPQVGVYGSWVFTNTSEDCLHLNIWTPAALDERTARPLAPLLPVMVFIHGGGWTQGATSYPLYTSGIYANGSSGEPAVVVTLNYRLGALGHLASPALDTPDALRGNYAIHDQRLALEWVHANISGFGGDPRRVTVFGQSAGAISGTAPPASFHHLRGPRLTGRPADPRDAVAVHMTAPSLATSPLFQRAIIQSNPFGIRFRTVSENAKCSILFAGLLGCRAADLACLRNKSVADVLHAQSRAVCIPPLHDISLFNDVTWQPLLDGDFIREQPLDAFAAGRFAAMPVILGTVQNETTSFLYGGLKKPLSRLAYEAALVAWFGPSTAGRVLALYPPPSASSGHGDARAVFSELATDRFMLCPTRQAVRHLAARGAPAVFWYVFQHVPAHDPMNNSSYCRRAVCHGADLAYTFQAAERIPGFRFEPAELALARNWVAYWRAFAAGDADTGRGFVRPAPWPPYVRREDIALRMDLRLRLQTGYRAAQCDFWDAQEAAAADAGPGVRVGS